MDAGGGGRCGRRTPVFLICLFAPFFSSFSSIVYFRIRSQIQSLSIHVDSVVTLQRRITVTGFARAFVHKELPIETMFA
jgi:hypothetical protein